MKFLNIVIILLLLAFPGTAAALSAQEVLDLKKAGVSDATIQKMLEQERLGAVAGSPVTETENEVVYQAGENNAARAEENRRHERWKEEKSLEAVGNVIIDNRSSTSSDFSSGSTGSGTSSSSAGK
jgi:hypothetical protein